MTAPKGEAPELRALFESFVSDAKGLAHVYRKGLETDKAVECFERSLAAMRAALAAHPNEPRSEDMTREELLALADRLDRRLGFTERDLDAAASLIRSLAEQEPE